MVLGGVNTVSLRSLADRDCPGCLTAAAVWQGMMANEPCQNDPFGVWMLAWMSDVSEAQADTDRQAAGRCATGRDIRARAAATAP
jgi:hypothetical protein